MAGLFCRYAWVGTVSRIGGLRAPVGMSGCTMVQPYITSRVMKKSASAGVP